ncbi:hypothetical protein EIP86_001431 [Pleurotus ostreatoroseus]|nr:hypothetical protein EIP86_001431 [Pleurotus ostreatoroseus]
MDQFEDEHHIWDDDPDEPVDGLPMVDPITGKKILRPRNAWILYRNARLEQVGKLPDGSRRPMAQASKIISAWWKSETKEVKAMYELQAEREKEEHRRKYPHYKFQPKSKQQKQREQAAKKEAKKKMQLANKKGRTRGITPPTFSSTQTSYVAAALANQAATSSNLAPSLVPPTLSPPLSLASTPLSGPSPLSNSDHESSAYSTSATSPMSASPASALGLGLPSMTFSGQEAANARVPQRTPARLPPRPKGQRHNSGSSATSRVPSSSTVNPPTPPAASPAPSNMLSPLPWPPIQQQPTPEPEGHSPPALSTIHEEASTSFDAWLNEGAYEAVPDPSGPVSVEIGFPPTFDLSEFANAFDPSELPPLDATDGQGVFQLSADSFRDSAPGQIDVSLGTLHTPNVTTEEREAFSMLLQAFDFNSMMQAANAANDHETFSFDQSQADTSGDGWANFQGANSMLLGNVMTGEELLASYATQENETQQMEFDHLNMDFTPTPTHPEPQAQFQPPQTQPMQPSAPSQPSFPHDVPPQLAQNPLFQDWFQSYIASTQAGPSSQPPPLPPAVAQNLPQQPYTQASPSNSRVSSASYQPSPPPSSQHSYSAPNHAPSASTTTPEKTAYASSSTGAFVPPPGAHRTHERRVAASWRPPIPPQRSNMWSVPTTPGNMPA